MDDKQLLAKFAAAALTGLLAGPKKWSTNGDAVNTDKQYASLAVDIAQAMLAEFKQRTEQKGNENG